LVFRSPKNCLKNESSKKGFEKSVWYCLISVTFIPTTAGLTFETVSVKIFLRELFIALLAFSRAFWLNNPAGSKKKPKNRFSSISYSIVLQNYDVQK